MKFNQLYASFPRFLETFSPFSGRKRKRDLAENAGDSLSARPTKQAQTAAQHSIPGAPAVSHHSNTRVAFVAAQSKGSLPQPADPLREETSQSAQLAHNRAVAQPASDTLLQPARLSAGSAHRQQSQQPSQEACDTEQELQRRVEATERQMAALQQQLNSIRKDPASQADTAEGATINLQEREQYGRLVELNRARDAQSALQHDNNKQQAAARPTSPIVLDDAAQTPMPRSARSYEQKQIPQSRSGHGQQTWRCHQESDTSRRAAQAAAGASAHFGPPFGTSLGFSPGLTANPAFGPRFTAASGNSPFVRSPSLFQALQYEAPAHRFRQRDPVDLKVHELMEALQMHRPYEVQLRSTEHKQAAARSTAELDLDDVLARANSVTGPRAQNLTGISQSSLHAATQEAERIMEHKSFMRRSQTAAHAPLPQHDAKAAPTAAQQRLQTAAEPQRSIAVKIRQPPSRSWRQAEEEEQTAEAGSGDFEADEYEEEDGYREEEEDGSAEHSSDQSESELSAAFSELSQRAGRLEPVQKPSRAMLDLKDKAFASGPDSEKLVEHVHSAVDVARKDIRTLKSRQWLNDEIMNVYMGLLQERDVKMREQTGFPKCHFFNTFFMNKLYKDDKKYLYKNVRKWTSKMRLKRWGQPSETVLECDKLIIPVHLGCHWTCAVISLRDHEIWYFDSLGGKEPEIVESLANYVADEYEDKLKEKVDTKGWTRRSPNDIPKQLNGCDCGVFALMFAEYQSRDAPFTFDQRHMEYFRVKVVADIMSLKVDSPGQIV